MDACTKRTILAEIKKQSLYTLRIVLNNKKN